MRTYSEEYKASLVKKMLPPNNQSVPELADETGIPKDTLYSWRSKHREAKGVAVPAHDRAAEKWSSEEKFAVVLETAVLSGAELSEYCRKKGLYAEQVEIWKGACLRANEGAGLPSKAERAKSQSQAKKIKQLEAELRRKEKALAEAAALLVLQKKTQALWGEAEDA